MTKAQLIEMYRTVRKRADNFELQVQELTKELEQKNDIHELNIRKLRKKIDDYACEKVERNRQIYAKDNVINILTKKLYSMVDRDELEKEREFRDDLNKRYEVVIYALVNDCTAEEACINYGYNDVDSVRDVLYWKRDRYKIEKSNKWQKISGIKSINIKESNYEG